MKRRARKSPTAAALLVAACAVSAPAAAAPDEDALGKKDGYPACPSALEIRCLVGLMSRVDELVPTRRVPRAPQARRLAQAPSEPKFAYPWQGETRTVDAYLARNHVTGLLLLRDETILLERYQYDRTGAHRMSSMSMAKTVVAMLVGIAIAEGRIRSVDDRVEAYLPELFGTAYGTTPIRHLLWMSSGVRFSETYDGKDDVARLNRLALLGGSAGGIETVKPFDERVRPSGERFAYSSADTQVLGLVLRAATGVPLADYLSEKIWQPMGAEADATWLVDKGGYETGYTGLNATLRDWARFGLLLAHDGARGGTQVIPAEWVRAATVPPAPAFEPVRTGTFFGYGYQTWILPGWGRQFAMRGILQQWIFVDPATRTVLVQTGVGELVSPATELLALWRALLETNGK